MTMTFTNGSVTTTSSEQNLFDVIGQAIYALHIFTNDMASGDIVDIKIYVKDQTGNTMRLFDTITLSGDQPADAGYIDGIPARQYKVSIQRTGGSDNTFNWDRVEIT
jgi:hypothetical protein